MDGSGADASDVDGSGVDGPTLDGPALDEYVLGAPREFTQAEVIAITGLDEQEAHGLWRALGFPEAPADERTFTRLDVETAGLVAHLSTEWLPDQAGREAVARAVAQSMSQLAEWQVGMLAQVATSQARSTTNEPDPLQAARLAADLLPDLERLQTYVWRRHLAAVAARWVESARDADAPGTRPLTVGFADMVGFTRTTRRRSMDELSETIERFGVVTTEVVAGGRGRIVKTIGDEVLFVTEHPADAATIALALRDRVRDEPSLPELRTGLAHGRVLHRYGDVYGEVVNVAARLTSEARPDTVLVDQELHDVLRDDPRFTLRRLPARHTRGYGHLKAWALREGRDA